MAENSTQIVSLLKDTDDSELRRMGERGRERVLAEHSSNRRAEEFENQVTHARSRATSTPILRRSASVTNTALVGEEYQPFP